MQYAAVRMRDQEVSLTCRTYVPYVFPFSVSPINLKPCRPRSIRRCCCAGMLNARMSFDEFFSVESTRFLPKDHLPCPRMALLNFATCFGLFCLQMSI